jgi:hypothetical protein
LSLAAAKPAAAIVKKSASKGSSQGTAPAGVDPNANAADLKQDMDDLRGDLRSWGTGVGAAATAILTGLGWTQADRLFPLPPAFWVKAVAIACTVAAVGGSVSLFMRLYTAQRRILIGSDLPIPRHQGLRNSERPEIMRVLDEHARAERAVHLRDLDARASRLDRTAVTLDLEGSAELANAARKESERLGNYVSLALRRAGVYLLERRARDAMSSGRTWVGVLATAFGIAGLFAMANYSQGLRQSPPANKALACLKTVDASGTAAGWEQITLDEACAKLLAP